MTGTVHIYRAGCQPATDYIDNCGPEPMRFTCSDRALFGTECCRKRRWAKYVEVQVYYDGLRRWCVSGHGCKSAEGRE